MKQKDLIHILILFLMLINFGCQSSSSSTKESEKVEYIKHRGKKVRHGPYEKNDQYGKVLGMFKYGNYAGVWRYYDEEGNYVHGYDFNSERFLKYTPIKSRYNQFHFYHDNEWFKYNREGFSPPKFKLGNPGYNRIYRRNIYYPVSAQEDTLEGRVIIEATINQRGNIINEKVKKSISKPLDRVALEVIKSIPDLWEPGRFNDKKVISKLFFPVSFQVKGVERNIKHGPFVKRDNHGKITGNYNKGKRAGNWKYFNKDGEYVHGYNFKNDTFLKYQPIKSRYNQFHFYNNDKWVKHIKEGFTPPKFKLGNPGFVRIYNKKISYPEEAKENQLQGRVIVACTINRFGYISDVSIRESVAEPLDNVALEVINALPNLWKPATYNDNLVKSKVFFPVTFKLKNASK